MNFLLKIVEGPNKGAEVALVEGVSVTLGNADECDIVLADPTMGDAPMKLEATSEEVMLDGEPMEQLRVEVRGSTAFAVGPADSAWGRLTWPQRSEERREADAAGEAASEGEAKAADGKSDGDGKKASPKRRAGCLGCALVFVGLLLVLGALCWIFRERLAPYAEQHAGGAAKWTAAKWNSFWSGASRGGDGLGESASIDEQAAAVPPIEIVMKRHSLSESNRRGRKVLVGNFATRAERLLATAEAYEAQPGVDLDFADSESLMTAVADTLALVGETWLAVKAVTNRVAVLSGTVDDLRRTLEAISADVPKVANVDVAGVVVRQLSIPGAVVPVVEEAAAEEPEPEQEAVAEVKKPEPESAPESASVAIAEAKKPEPPVEKPKPLPAVSVPVVSKVPALPVCGILTTPYPCLVLKDGRRIMEGAPIGDSVVLKIGIDSVMITNSTGRMIWRP